VSAAGELVERFGQDPVFRPVDPPRAVARGLGAGVAVAAAVRGPAVHPVRLKAPTARPADQPAGQPVAAFAVVVWCTGGADVLGGEEVGVTDQRRVRPLIGDHPVGLAVPHPDRSAAGVFVAGHGFAVIGRCRFHTCRPV
jgi:hypothetical protein